MHIIIDFHNTVTFTFSQKQYVFEPNGGSEHAGQKVSWLS